MIMKLDFLCPRQYCDVGEMIKRSDAAMKKAEGFTLRIEGNKIFVNREPETDEEKQRFYAAIAKVYYGICDSTARNAIVKEMSSLLKGGENDEEQP